MLEVALDRSREEDPSPRAFLPVSTSLENVADNLPLPGRAESAGSRPSAEAWACSLEGAEPTLHKGCILCQGLDSVISVLVRPHSGALDDAPEKHAHIESFSREHLIGPDLT